MDEVKLTFYDAFLREFYNVDDLNAVATPLGRGAYLHNFPDLRLSVAALNSCERESHRSQDHRGYVSREQARAVMDAWRSGDPSSWIKVLAVHHNPVSTSNYVCIGHRVTIFRDNKT